MTGMIETTSYDIEKLLEACNKLFQSCTICTAIGRTAGQNKLVTTHVNAAFSKEIQADRLYFTIHIGTMNNEHCGPRY